MANLTMGVHEFKPSELVKLIKQYDCFMISQVVFTDPGAVQVGQTGDGNRWRKLHYLPQ